MSYTLNDQVLSNYGFASGDNVDSHITYDPAYPKWNQANTVLSTGNDEGFNYYTNYIIDIKILHRCLLCDRKDMANNYTLSAPW